MFHNAQQLAQLPHGAPLSNSLSWKSPTYQPTAKPSEFIAKQVVYPSDSCSGRELNVRIVWPATRMMVFCHDRTNITIRTSKSIEDRDIGKKKKFAPLWKVLSEKLKVLLLGGDDTGTSVVPALNKRSQVLSIKDRRNGVWKPMFSSNLLHLETYSCLILLLLIFVFLVCLMYCNKSSLKPAICLRIARPMSDGRPFTSSLFRRLAGRGPFILCFPFRWASQFALDAPPYHIKGSKHECGRPHDTLAGLFSTALWLRQSQSILTQEVQHTKDFDLTCYKTMPTKSATCLQVEPMSLEWPVAPPAGSDQSSLSSSHEDPNDEHLEDALPVLPFTLDARCSPTTSKTTR